MGLPRTSAEIIAADDLRVSTYSRPSTDVEREHFESIVRTLRRRRLELDITQEQLEHELGVSQGLVAKWERFDRLPSSFMFACWCQVLSIRLVPIAL